MLEQISQFFETIPSWQRTLILAGGLTFFLLLEGVIPIHRTHYQKFRHLGLNMFFTATTLVVNFLFAIIIVMVSDWTVANNVGILHLFPMPLIVQVLVGLIILDFVGSYVIHWIQHKVYWMWKFHVIHHTDSHVDTTTALRHHPGESVFRAVFTTLAVGLAGAPIWLVMLYQSLSAFASQFNHANLRMPARLEKVLRLVIVTPTMHRVHHHHKQPFTDTNYGNIFSFWDRIFGTYAVLSPEEIVYGLDVYEERDDDLGKLLKVPVDGRSYRRAESQGE